MTVLRASNIAYRFDNGEELFRDISVKLTVRRVGLVGRNGIGKSILASIFAKEIQPSTGNIEVVSAIGRYTQLPSHILNSSISIAEFLGVDSILHALDQVAKGSAEQKWFDLIGERWQLKDELTQLLFDIGLPEDIQLPCNRLSGGQLSRLSLWKLFHSDAQLLILDEPSNHLDLSAKNWLLEQIDLFPGYILLISHDRLLLRHMEQIWELNTLGLHQYGGNYDFFRQQKQKEMDAVERQLNEAQKEKRKLDKQTQTDREKAEQRASQGNKLRKQGSQAKVLLDAKKDKATANASARNKNVQKRADLLHQKTQDLKDRKEGLKAQRMYLDSAGERNKSLVHISECLLPYTSSQAINLHVKGTSRVHIKGDNGCGKTTLLRAIRGDIRPLQGEIRINTPVYYLDQHFGLLRNELSMLENLVHFCPQLGEERARTLLAGIGFRRDSVYRLVDQLSGGEKMKLAMLIVSHQADQPLLLLDEPDNHLDLDSKLILAEALNAYQGAFLLISHDEDFVATSGITEVYDFNT